MGSIPEPPKSVEVEIYADGRLLHHFVAEEMSATESRERLILVARRWEPDRMPVVGCPELGPTGTPVDGFLASMD